VVKALREKCHVTNSALLAEACRRPSEDCCAVEGGSSGHQRGLAGAAAWGLYISEGAGISNVPGAEVLA